MNVLLRCKLVGRIGERRVRYRDDDVGLVHWPGSAVESLDYGGAERAATGPTVFALEDDPAAVRKVTFSGGALFREETFCSSG